MVRNAKVKTSREPVTIGTGNHNEAMMGRVVKLQNKSEFAIFIGLFQSLAVTDGNIAQTILIGVLLAISIHIKKDLASNGSNARDGFGQRRFRALGYHFLYPVQFRAAKASQ